LKFIHDLPWPSAFALSAGDSKSLHSDKNLKLLVAIESLQLRMENDVGDDLAPDIFVNRYQANLPLLQAAVDCPETSDAAMYLLTIFLANRVDVTSMGLVTVEETNPIINSLFSRIDSKNTSTAKNALICLNNFTNLRLDSSATSHEVSAYILGRLRHCAATLAAQLSVPGLYAPTMALFIDMAKTSPAHARDVMVAIAADSSAKRVLSNTLLNSEFSQYPNFLDRAAMTFLGIVIRQLDNFDETLNSLSSRRAKVAFLHEYSGACNSFFKPSPVLVAAIFDSIKRLFETDFSFSVALVMAAIGINNRPQIEQYLSHLSAKPDLTQLDKSVLNVFTAATVMADGSSAELLASTDFTPKQKLIFLDNFYQRHELISRDTEDRQYRYLHASSMSEEFKTQARQMILRASPDQPAAELARLTQVLENGLDTLPIFVAARALLEDLIKNEIPDFFMNQIADNANQETTLAYTVLRQEYFVLYNTFLSNPLAAVSLDFIRAELARIEALPLDMKDVLKTMLNAHARQLVSQQSYLAESKL
jgi:hypothetical protein